MLKYVGAAVTVAAVVYEVTTLAYGALLVGVAAPAEHRCETGATNLLDQMERNPGMDPSEFLKVSQTCNKSATVVSALLPPGLKP